MKRLKKKLSEVGRRSLYNETMPERVYRLSLLGLTDPELCVAFGISHQTLDNWKLKYPQFVQAMWKGKIEADSKVAESLFRKACGYSHEDIDLRVIEGELVKTEIVKHYPPDTGAACFWLKNRSRRNKVPWKEIARTEVTGNDGGPIQGKIEVSIPKALDLSNLSDTELDMCKNIGIKIANQED